MTTQINIPKEVYADIVIDWETDNSYKSTIELRSKKDNSLITYYHVSTECSIYINSSFILIES